ncbi:hypothetical protein NHX12_013088 [Muraenolepis orangiensis]|uniref:Uncharacterized protein n=1 Tax=Muraenolepis orangiensis TaxID=630683 RepID=A0A9Q0I4L6_9TELE|nr:hypothetical protein NHX12_013088 [Muraenolepis orangiensis]
MAGRLLVKVELAKLHLPKHKLVHDVSTRWNGSLHMLERFGEKPPTVGDAVLSGRRGEDGPPSSPPWDGGWDGGGTEERMQGSHWAPSP